MEKGYVQIYTGNGKGKTTAALGLITRAVGSNFKIFFCQFLKGRDYGELHTLKKFETVVHERYGRGVFIMRYDLISVDEIKFLIENKPETTELVLTGRNAPDELIELADLVTEMREVKHYFQKGVMARKGIEK